MSKKHIEECVRTSLEGYFRDLRGIEPDRYELICLPLKLVGSDGAPARTILVG